MKNKKEYNKEYYQKNKEHLKEKSREWRQKNKAKIKEYNKKYRKRRRKYYINYRKQIKEWLDKIKLDRGCEICGYNKCVGALDFHHRDSEKKEFLISRLRTTKKEILLKEIKKCQVLCANCHRELHYNNKVLQKV